MYAGIDVGAGGVHVAIIDCDYDGEALSIETHQVDFVGQRWWETLSDLIGECTHVALEPTGVYSRPLLSFFSIAHPDLCVLEVSNAVTGRFREAFVSSQKTDKQDARALALIAKDFSDSGRVRGVRLSSLLTDDLRMLVNYRRSLVKEQTRLKNRFKSLAAGIDPALGARSDIWLKSGCRHPDGVLQEFNEAVQNKEVDEYLGRGGHKARKALQNLVDALSPTLLLRPYQMSVIQSTAFRLKQYEDLIASADDSIRRTAFDINPLLFEAWSGLPYLGDFGAACLLVAARGSLKDFDVNEWRAVVGWRPVRTESGEHSFSSMAKVGYRPAKAAIYMMTRGALRSPSPFPSVYDYFHSSASKARLYATCGKMTRVLFGIGKAAEEGREWYVE